MPPRNMGTRSTRACRGFMTTPAEVLTRGPLASPEASPLAGVRVTSAAGEHHGEAYRRDIDGLRAFAVLAVVTFHAFPWLMPGGFVHFPSADSSSCACLGSPGKRRGRGCAGGGLWKPLGVTDTLYRSWPSVKNAALRLSCSRPSGVCSGA